MKHPLFFSFCLLFLAACSNSTGTTDTTTSFDKCKYGSPKPIFSDKVPLVSSHSFKLNDNEAIETVFFDADIKLELIQSGCEKPRQEFRFTLPGDSKGYTAEDWIDMALNQFNFLGNLHEPLLPLLFWANALKEKRSSIKLGEPVPLEQKYFVKIDKVAGEKSGLLIVVLYQE